MGQSKSDSYIMYKVALAAALMAVAIADNVPVAYAPVSAYKPAPYKEEKLPPQPFAFEFGVADDYSKANFKKTDAEEDKVIGSFVSVYPDGRIQTTYAPYAVVPYRRVYSPYPYFRVGYNPN